WLARLRAPLAARRRGPQPPPMSPLGVTAFAHSCRPPHHGKLSAYPPWSRCGCSRYYLEIGKSARPSREPRDGAGLRRIEWVIFVWIMPESCAFPRLFAFRAQLEITWHAGAIVQPAVLPA